MQTLFEMAIKTKIKAYLILTLNVPFAFNAKSMHISSCCVRAVASRSPNKQQKEAAP
jgi:hypothetical protein